jgi:ComF family protein
VSFFWSRVVRDAARLFFPPLCLLCAVPLEAERPEVCRTCRSAFRRPRQPFCSRCGSPVALPRESCQVCADWRALGGARSVFLYTGALRVWVHELKYAGMTALAALVGEALAGEVAQAPLAWRQVAALVPVPLHAARRRERGFNQAELLAHELARHWPIPVLPLLARLRPTLPQAALGATARRSNVRDAFGAAPEFAAFCQGRGFLLIDDVLTTGSTLEACASALIHAGAASILALTVARALPDLPRGPHTWP